LRSAAAATRATASVTSSCARWSWSTGGASLRQVVLLHGGLDVPTTSELDGLPIEAAQLRCVLGRREGGLWALCLAAVSLRQRERARVHPRPLQGDPGAVLLFTVSGPLQHSTAFALSLSADARLDAAAPEHGADDSHSGGYLTMLTPELRWSPVTGDRLDDRGRCWASDHHRAPGHAQRGRRRRPGVTCDL